MEELIYIPKEEYEKLIRRSDMLAALENGGVDDWEWYSESLEEYRRKYFPEDYEE